MFLVEQVLSSVADLTSPVYGEPWPKLDGDYAEEKKKAGFNPVPDLQRSGEMLDALTFKTTKDGIEIGFFGDQAWKADGHLKFSGEENNIKKRRFLPEEGQRFKDSITDEVDRIILDAQTENVSIKRSELKDIETKTQLYDYLEMKLGVDSRSELKLAVLRNAELTELLDEFDLLELL